jgi:integrase
MSPKRSADKEFKDLVQYPNGTYYLRYWSTKLQRIVEKSLQTDVRAKALRLRKSHIENVGEEFSKEAVQFKTFRHVVKAFLSERIWKAQSTKLSAMNQFENHLLPFFGDYAPGRIDNGLWARFVEERRTDLPGASTANANKYLTMVLTWAHRKGVVKESPSFENFDKGRKSPGRVIQELEYRAIWKHLPPMWQDIADIAWHMAMRLGEIKGLEWSRVNLTTGDITLLPENVKTRKGRKPVAPPQVLDILLRRRKEVGDSPWVFPSPRDPTKPMSTKDEPWQDAKVEAGIKCRFHDLRHTWLTKAFKATNKYAEVCAYAGLSLDMALKIYVKFDHTDMRAISDLQVGKFGEPSQNV